MNEPASSCCPAETARRRRPYTIVQLTSSGDMGGTERMTLELAARLDHNLFHPIVLCLVGGDTLVEECRRRGVEAEHLHCRHPLDWRAWRRYADILRTRGVSLVHLYGLRANIPGRHLARRAKVGCVVAGIRSTDPWRRWYHVWLDRWTARYVDVFVSNSEAGRQAAIRRERIPGDRIKVIPNGVEMPPAVSFDAAALRRKFGLSEHDGPVLAVVANLGPEKRHRDLIDAVASLAADFPHMAVLCAGRDEMGGANQQYAAARGVEGQFRWLGRVDNVAEVFAAADFAVLPSRHEGMPASVLEAMAMGKAVIASDVGGIPEVIRHKENGLLVPPLQPAALADAIRILASDRALCERIGQAARRAVEEHFSMAGMVERIQDLYLEYLEGGREPKARGD
ncbi:MAG: glycosyltransferase [Candidatus Sumerlaeia bacterium]|nr:glycosyltransferase [Candidatus Sumerlaeia bacterium]